MLGTPGLMFAGLAKQTISRYVFGFHFESLSTGRPIALSLLIAYWLPGKPSEQGAFLLIGERLDEAQEKHPREYAKAEQVYRDQYADRKHKAKKERGVFHATEGE